MDKSKLPTRLLINIGGIIAFIVAGLLLVSGFLSMITHHGRFVETPDLVGLQIDSASIVARKAHVKIEVEDSNFVKTVAHGAIYMQDPPAGSLVKKGRHIRLLVNTVSARKVKLPNVVECPLRQAVSELTAKGFSVGRIYYEPGYDDRVIDMVKGGRKIRSGSLVESGSSIDLKVGFSNTSRFATVPSVVGKKGAQATKEIQEHSLNVKLSYDASVKTADDKFKAVVVRQSPAAGSKNAVKGADVTIYLSVDPEKISK